MNCLSCEMPLAPSTLVAALDDESLEVGASEQGNLISSQQGRLVCPGCGCIMGLSARFYYS